MKTSMHMLPAYYVYQDAREAHDVFIEQIDAFKACMANRCDTDDAPSKQDMATHPTGLPLQQINLCVGTPPIGLQLANKGKKVNLNHLPLSKVSLIASSASPAAVVSNRKIGTHTPSHKRYGSEDESSNKSRRRAYNIEMDDLVRGSTIFETCSSAANAMATK